VDEAADLIPSHIVTMQQLNEWEASNIILAIEWLFSTRRLEIFTDSFAKQLHSRMFAQTWRWAGRFRQSDKNIGVHWPQIPVAVQDVCKNADYRIAHQTFPLDEIAVRFHHEMVGVHPFPNGNGRHARLLADALLFRHDLPRMTWGGGNLQQIGSTERRTYLEALKRADQGDIGDLLRVARS
jgi:Fic-DOC domain mobile mystery protein B